MLLQQLLSKASGLSASAMRASAFGRGRQQLCSRNGGLWRIQTTSVRWKSALAAARKQSIPRDDFLSVEEALGNRCPPPLESYDDEDDSFAVPTPPKSAVVSFEGTSPTASPVDQTRTPSLRQNSAFASNDDDFMDDDVEEEMVSDVLRDHSAPKTSPRRAVPFGKTISPVASSNYVTDETFQTAAATTAPTKPKYTLPSAEELELTLETVLAEITAQNNGTPVNVNSTKQVATALFGPAGGSTRKDVLEGMASAGNRMADLILKYRDAKYKLGKIQRRSESETKGTAVRSALTVKRVHNETHSVDDDQRDPLILVDASAYIFRAYYSMPPIHRSDGMPTGAVMGFCKMLNAMLLDSMVQGEQPRLVLCFDAKGKTFRHDMYPKYKGNRPSAPVDLVPQFDLVRQAADAYGIAQIEAYGFEADDVIATLATKALEEGVDANILSGDKDLMQLVTDFGATPSIQMTDPMKRETSTYKEVVAKWEVEPRLLGDVLALAGDTADNVPGVKGIGVKTAAKLIQEYGSLKDVLSNIDNIKQKGLRQKLDAGQNDARISRQLVELRRDVPIEQLVGLPFEVAVSELRMEPMNPGRILGFYESMGFRELQATFKSKVQGKKVQRKASTRRPKIEVPQPEDFADVPF